MKKLFLILISIATVMTACESLDFGDTNKNINGPGDANTASLLSGAITRFSTLQGRPYRITPALNVQYLQQNVYNDEMLYANTPGSWTSYYVQTISNLQEVINICSAEESAADPLILANGSLNNQIAVAKIMKAVMFKRVTDLFGDIPYSEAFDPQNLTPAFDSQESIYKSMIADVKAARDMIELAKLGAKGDVIYRGNMAAWQTFANSFILNLSMQLSKVYPGASEYAATEFKAALAHSAGVIETLGEEAWYTYDVANGFNNPWNWMRPADYGVTKEFSDAMRGDGFTSNSTRDNRIDLFVVDATDEGLPYGYLNYATGNASEVNPVIYNPATKLAVLTASYTYLHRAEAASLGWTTETAATMLQTGIQMSYATLKAHLDPTDMYGIGDGVAYAAARAVDMGTAGAAKVIGEEKWVALFPLGFEAWSEWRRTGFPVLSPAPDAINDGQIPTRYNYPTNETTLNAAGYAQGKSTLTPAEDKNTAKVWWDK